MRRGVQRSSFSQPAFRSNCTNAITTRKVITHKKKAESLTKKFQYVVFFFFEQRGEGERALDRGHRKKMNEGVALGSDATESCNCVFSIPYSRARPTFSSPQTENKPQLNPCKTFQSSFFFFFLVAHSFIITTKKSLTLSLFTKSMYAPSYFPLGHFHTTLDSLFFSQPSLSFFFLKRRRKMKLIFLFKLQLSHWSSSFSSPARCEDAARHHHR